MIYCLCVQVARVESQLAEAVAAREQLKSQLEHVNEQIAKLPPAKTAAGSKAGTKDGGSSLSSEEKDEIAKLEKQIVEQTSALAAAEDKCKQLQSQIADKNKELEKLTKQVQDLEDRKLEWEKDLKTLRDGKEGHTKKMNQLNAQLDAEQKKLDQLMKLEAQADQGRKELKE